MKYYFVSLAALILSSAANSQVTFGVQVGTQSSNSDFVISPQGIKPVSSTSSVMGFKIGGVASIPISKSFAFMPELNFVTKGVNYTDNYNPSNPSSTTYKRESNFRTSYLEIPLNFAYNSSAFFFGLGPVISLGVGGTATFRESNNGAAFMSEDFSIKFDGQSNSTATDDKIHLKGLEFGGNVFIGYKFTRSVFVQAMYNTSFTDIFPSETSYTTKYKSSYFGLTIGYLFGKVVKEKK